MRRGPSSLKSAKGYESRLRRAKVVADFAARRELIRAGVIAAARRTGSGHGADRGGIARRSHRPGRMAGADRRPIRAAIPAPAARSRDRHRAGPSALFPGGGRRRRLSGGSSRSAISRAAIPAKVREGNERVVRPRLSDAAFFWEQDRKISLEEHAAKLAGVTFQTKLGSYADKTLRVRRWRNDRQPHRRRKPGGARRPARQGRPDDGHGG
jgi:glycyl-tRNA synthetase beta chain